MARRSAIKTSRAVRYYRLSLQENPDNAGRGNIGHFTELVKEMSIKTQFVLITHSKKTMSIAPVLRHDHAGAGSVEASVGQIWSRIAS